LEQSQVGNKGNFGTKAILEQEQFWNKSNNFGTKAILEQSQV
jgi:hypothetical protein